MNANFSGMLWARARDAAMRQTLWLGEGWVRPSGQLHVASPAERRRVARLGRRRILQNRARYWWWRVRAPLRRWGGCPEEE